MARRLDGQTNWIHENVLTMLESVKNLWGKFRMYKKFLNKSIGKNQS